MFNQLRCRWQPLLAGLIGLALIFSSQPAIAGAAGGKPPAGGQVNWAETTTPSRLQKPAGLMAAADRNRPQQTARLASAAATTFYYYAVSVGTWLECHASPYTGPGGLSQTGPDCLTQTGPAASPKVGQAASPKVGQWPDLSLRLPGILTGILPVRSP